MTCLIFTEKKPNLDRLCSTFFDGFTIMDAKGFWQGVGEESAVIIIVSEDTKRVESLCRLIKTCNSQESVLLVSLQGEERFI